MRYELKEPSFEEKGIIMNQKEIDGNRSQVAYSSEGKMKGSTRSATPAPGSAITESDKPMAITPSTTCAICRPLGEMASAFKYWLFPHSNNYTGIC